MPATVLIDLSGNVHDLVGDDFDERRTKVVLAANTDHIVAADLGEVRVGTATVNVAADGTFEFVDVIASTDLVENLQYTVRVDYPQTSDRSRKQETFGPYELTTDADIVDLEAVQALDPSYASATLAQMQALLDDVVDISGISTSDGVVAALINTAGGPLTQAALSMAVGLDASGATNITTSLNAQMAALSAAGGGRLRLPVGTFLSSQGAIYIPSNVILEGSGPGTVIKLGPNAANHLIRTTGSPVNGGINNLTLDGDGTNQGGGSTNRNALCPTGATNFQIGTVWVKDTSGDACLLVGCVNTTLGKLIATDVGRNVFACEDAAGTQTVGVVAGLIYGKAKAGSALLNAGIDIEPATDVAISTVVVDGFHWNVAVVALATGDCKNIVISTLVGKNATAGHHGILIDATAGDVDNVTIGTVVLDNPLADGDFDIAGTPTNVQFPGPGVDEVGTVRYPANIHAAGVMLATGLYVGTGTDNGSTKWLVDSSGRPRWLVAGTITTTVGAAGAASALPATPEKYLTVLDAAGNPFKIPAYNP